MNKFKKIKIIKTIVLSISLLLVSSTFITAASKRKIEIMVNNPFKISMNIMVKCDWNNEKQDFEFIKYYSIKSGKVTIISMPKAFQNCQIWPTKINLF